MVNFFFFLTFTLLGKETFLLIVLELSLKYAVQASVFGVKLICISFNRFFFF